MSRKSFAKLGQTIEKIIELNRNQNHKTDDIEFVCLPARHFSGRGILNQKTTLWSSWAIKTASINIYFSGDSGYGKHLKQIGLDHGPFDLSLIDCGQYNQAWYNVHMFPDHVVKAANDLNSIYFMPIHWGGVTLSTHAWDEPAREIIRLSERIKAKYVIPKIGEVISKKTIDKPTTRWWERY